MLPSRQLSTIGSAAKLYDAHASGLPLGLSAPEQPTCADVLFAVSGGNSIRAGGSPLAVLRWHGHPVPDDPDASDKVVATIPYPTVFAKAPVICQCELHRFRPLRTNFGPSSLLISPADPTLCSTKTGAGSPSTEMLRVTHLPTCDSQRSITKLPR